MRDMEIRGAGNLLGQQQHGFIAAVGLDLYSQLLQEEIATLKGEPPPAEAPRFPNMDLTVHAYLPQEYLPSEELRILFYKKLVSAENAEALQAVRSELEDRFGPMPPEAETLLRVSSLRIQARDLGIAGVAQKSAAMDIQFLQNTPIEPVSLLQLAHERPHARFKPGPPFTLIIDQEGYTSSGALSYLENLFAWLARELSYGTGARKG
jgi:transcription-repair coupling factor (superfamily II helicase)